MSSPKIIKLEQAQVDFTEAIKQVLTGKSVTKKEWGDRKYYAILDGERLRLHKPDGKLYDWIISEGDMRGDDYIVI